MDANRLELGAAGRAPMDLAQLREMVAAIAAGAGPVSLGGKSLAVLGELVERPQQTAVCSITELAALLAVHASTLSRLARALGFAGFADFQKIFRSSLGAAGRHFYSDQASRLFGEQDSGANDAVAPHTAVVQRLFAESQENIAACLARLDFERLNSAAAALARARRVRVHGVRQIHAVSSVLSYGLSLIRPDVGLLDSAEQGIATGLLHLDHNDVLVAVSLAPYSRIVVDAAHAAQAAGVGLIVLTDNPASPLAALAQSSFYVPHHSSFISNSTAACVVLCEALVNLVARVLGAAALDTLQNHEHIIERLRIEAD